MLSDSRTAEPSQLGKNVPNPVFAFSARAHLGQRCLEAGIGIRLRVMEALKRHFNHRGHREHRERSQATPLCRGSGHACRCCVAACRAPAGVHQLSSLNSWAPKPWRRRHPTRLGTPEDTENTEGSTRKCGLAGHKRRSVAPTALVQGSIRVPVRQLPERPAEHVGRNARFGPQIADAMSSGIFKKSLCVPLWCGFNSFVHSRRGRSSIH